MKLAGIRDIFVVIAPQTKHGIIDGLQSGLKFGVNICYVVQEKATTYDWVGSGDIICRRLDGTVQDFVVACGDSILCDFSSKNPFNCLQSLVNIHISIKPWLRCFSIQ